MVEHIYGIDYLVPDAPRKGLIDGFDLERKKQKFYRKPIPEIFNDLEFDADDEPVYSEEQLAFIDSELDRIDKGYFFFNNGKITYVTGLHYFYLQYWILENGEAPEYRAADRRYFYFHDYCKKQPHIDGIIRSKKRREGATSQATASLVRTAISKQKAFCGIVSKTGPDAKSAFLNMVKPGFQELPIFLKPNVEDPDSKTELLYQKKKNKVQKNKTKKKGQVFDESRGLGSRIDWKNTALNSYDSGREDEVLIDEGGKFPTDVPINEYWPIVKQVLRQGGRKVGFGLLPSTSNKMTKGGKGFKLLWDESNQFLNRKTATGLYRYFAEAYRGYVPFIDEYGEDILEKPTKEQAKWMRDHYEATDEQCEADGAKAWLEYERSLIKDPDALNEHKRMYPFSERDAFDFENGQNIYNAEKVRDQKDYLMSNPPKIRTVRFYRKLDGKADFVDDADGLWKILMLPNDSERWAQVERNGRVCPGNTHSYTLFADPFKNTIVTGKGSKGAAFIGKRFNPLDPENSGLPVAMFWGRPKLKRLFHEQMLLAAEYYGADICYESDIDDYIEYLMENSKMGYAKERPKSSIDPNRKKKKKTDKEFGIKSGDGFSYAAMIEASIAYFEEFYEKIFFIELLEQLEEYDEQERTLFDIAVAFQLFSLGIRDNVKPPEQKVAKLQNIVKTYNLNAKKY